MLSFHGAKGVLLAGDQLVCLLRDDFPDLPWPGYWDLPGGGREGQESPEACVIRETAEEIGVHLVPGDLVWRHARVNARGTGWFFGAVLDPGRARQIRLGSEGQRWALMTPEHYCAHPKAIPHFAEVVALFMSWHQSRAER